VGLEQFAKASFRKLFSQPCCSSSLG